MAVRGSAKWVAAVAIAAGLILTTVLVVAGGGDDDEADLVRGGTVGPVTETFLGNSGINSWTVPDYVTWITVTAVGAGGYGATGGLGATITASFNVAPGQVYEVRAAPGPGMCSLFRGNLNGYFVVAGAGGAAGNSTPGTFGGRGGDAGYANQAGSPGTKGGTLIKATYTATNAQFDVSRIFQNASSGLGGGGGPTSTFGTNPNYVPGAGYAGFTLIGGTSAPPPTGPRSLVDLVNYTFGSANWPYSSSSAEMVRSVTFDKTPFDGGLGGIGGCGFVGGQGGGAGFYGFGGGGGGGGSSYVPSFGFGVSSELNASISTQPKVTITYEVSPPTTTSSTSTTSTSTTSTSTTSTSTTVVPMTTATIAAEAATTTSTISTVPSTTPVNPGPASYRPLSVYPVRAVVALPKGVRVRTISISPSTRRVCRAVVDLIITLAPGTCNLTVTVSSGNKKIKIPAQFQVRN